MKKSTILCAPITNGIVVQIDLYYPDDQFASIPEVLSPIKDWIVTMEDVFEKTSFALREMDG